jgi:hypothetical protein
VLIFLHPFHKVYEMVTAGFAFGVENAAILGGANFKGRCQGAFCVGRGCFPEVRFS